MAAQTQEIAFRDAGFPDINQGDHPDPVLMKPV
jgi:hypothetical protein